MTHLPRKPQLNDQLWNVSLLPTVKAASSPTPPHAPNPSGGRALEAPALLSLSELVTRDSWRQAA